MVGLAAHLAAEVGSQGAGSKKQQISEEVIEVQATVWSYVVHASG